MATFNASVKITSKVKDLEKQILRDFIPYLRRKITANIGSVEQLIKGKIEAKLKSSPEYDSLTSGVLFRHFGLVNANEKVNEIIEALIKEIQIIPTPIAVQGGKLRGGARIIFNLKVAQNKLLSLPQAIQPTKGENLPWLEWLLKRSNEVIIEGYFEVDIKSIKSRTGSALMFKGVGKRWFVPEFTGTEDNNWLTRTLDKVDDDIAAALQTILK